jgi:hypothetical protein
MRDASRTPVHCRASSAACSASSRRGTTRWPARSTGSSWRRRWQRAAGTSSSCGTRSGRSCGHPAGVTPLRVCSFSGPHHNGSRLEVCRHCQHHCFICSTIQLSGRLCCTRAHNMLCCMPVGHKQVCVSGDMHTQHAVLVPVIQQQVRAFRRQAVAGLFAAGAWRSARYGAAKVAKFWRSRR